MTRRRPADHETCTACGDPMDVVRVTLGPRLCDHCLACAPPGYDPRHDPAVIEPVGDHAGCHRRRRHVSLDDLDQEPAP
jgi:hypothetical protein